VCRELSLARKSLELPLEQREMWFFTVDQDQGVLYDSHLLPFAVFTNMAHALFTCLSPALRLFPDPPPNLLRSAFTPESTEPNKVSLN
jgi:hypothetical protein